MTEEQQLNHVRWKMQECGVKDCWCGIIVPEEPMFYDNGMELYIAPSGTVLKENAKHIVDVHNMMLEVEKKAKYVVGLVQGTMALECQGLNDEQKQELLHESKVRRLLEEAVLDG